MSTHDTSRLCGAWRVSDCRSSSSSDGTLGIEAYHESVLERGHPLGHNHRQREGFGEGRDEPKRLMILKRHGDGLMMVSTSFIIGWVDQATPVILTGGHNSSRSSQCWYLQIP